MTPEELALLNGQVKTAALEAIKPVTDNATALATEAKEASVKVGKTMEELSESVKALGEKVAVLAKSPNAVSMAETGVSAKEARDVSMVKMIKGAITGDWRGAEKEQEIQKAVQQKAIEQGSSAAGGYLIPTELSSDIVDRIVAKNVLAQLGVIQARPQRLHFDIPKVNGGTTAYWVGENAEITESNMDFGLISMRPKIVAALTGASRTSVDSGDAGIMGIIENDLTKALSSAIMTKALYGDGTANTPIGLLNTVGIKTLNSGGTTTGDVPTFDFLLKMINKVEDDDIDGARWGFLSRAGVFNNLKTQKIPQFSGQTDGQPVFAPILSDAMLAAAIGTPFQKTSAVSKTNGTSTNLANLIYGDWSQFVMATWGGLMIESTSVGGKAFVNHMSLIKATMEMDFAVRGPTAFVNAGYVQQLTQS